MDQFLFHMESYIRSGGVVMFPILGVSFIMWTLIINRVHVMRKLFIKNIPRMEAGQLIRENRNAPQKVPGS